MTAFATDEDIAVRASGDFVALCPRDQTLAAGSDGVFDPGDPWTLRSASVDFRGHGLAPGQVVRLGKPSTCFGANGELFAIAAVGPGSITLRRKGQVAAVGQPPAPPAGLSGVEFSVRTLGPQIDRASYDLDLRFGIDELIAGRRPADLRDPVELREVVVLTVLYRQYQDQSRQFAGADKPDDWYAAKARIIKGERDDLIDRLALKWNAAGDASGPVAMTRFSMRLSR